MIEKTCCNCKHKGKRIDEKPCVKCMHAYLDNFEPVTNADWLRDMSIEELADFLFLVNNSAVKFTACDNRCDECVNDDEVCKELVRMWLKEVHND